VTLKALNGLPLVTRVTSKHSTSLHLTLEHFLERILKCRAKCWQNVPTRHYLLSTILGNIILPAPDHDLLGLTYLETVILAIRNTRYL
jgi:hypothetical protein